MKCHTPHPFSTGPAGRAHVARATPLSAVLAAVVAAYFGNAAFAQSPEPERVPIEVTDPVPAPAPDAGSGAAAADETIELMQTASRRLADAQLDAETARLHGEIVDRLRQLLEQAQQQSAQRLPVPSQSANSSPSPDGSSAGGTGEQGGPRQTDDAAESSDAPGGGEIGEGEVERRRNLATSVWGHLPPRERARMEGAFSERFLPQYDDLVRQYYEALATENEP